MDDNKTILKDVRDAINAKDYEQAVKNCKIILKKDKNNYIALVMLGVALQDSEHALLAFKKAITLKEDKALAWQGMASFYEKKITNDRFIELIPIYEKLLIIEDDMSKINEICKKVYDIVLNMSLTNGVKMLMNQMVTLNHPEKKKVLYMTVVNVFTNMKTILDEEFFSAFEDAFNTWDDLNDDLILNYFKNLHAIKGSEQMYITSMKYVQKHNSFVLREWVSKMYSEQFILEEARLSNISKSPLHVQQFIKFDIDSEIASMLKAVILYQNMDILKSYTVATNLWKSNEQNNFLLILIGYCCLKLQRWKEAENLSKRLSNHSEKQILMNAQVILLISLSSQNDNNKSHEAMALKNKMDISTFGTLEYSALFLANLQIQNYNDAEDCLSHLTTSDVYISLKATFLRKNNENREAIELLECNKTSSPSCWYQLGLLHWENFDYEESLIPFLQAAKIEPFNFQIFLFLGDYYSILEKNMEKAKKCYLKAFTLNPECSMAGKHLSNMYRNLQNWEANFDFLKNLTNCKDITDSWSLLELGLHHLALEQWDEAVLNFRTYLRFNPNDVHAWESLADCYYSRGSFTSALKCYQRSTQLNQHRKYSLVQIGAIQCLLGQYSDALVTYQSIDDESFLPALKGMAEVKLSISKDKFTQNLYGSCRSNAQEAICYATSAIIKESNFICLWTILSNAISIIASLPPKYRWLNIDPRFSIESKDTDDILINGEDLYLLAIRCLCRAINLSTSNQTFLYYELAIIYLDYYKTFKHSTIIQKAFHAIKKCIEVENSEWHYWNLMGVICMSENIKKYSLAQHAFVKALQLDHSNAMIWSNLGFLYYYLGNKVLSNKSFQRSQQFDPSYVQSWIGQGLIAESVGHEDAMDLFRHSSQLGFHKESSLGYAEWVCKMLLNCKDRHASRIEYSINNMYAVPTACDLMTWLHDYEFKNPCCLNIYGILLEKMGLINKANNCFEEALKYVDRKHRDIVLVNYGRTLVRLKKYDLAVDIFKSVSEANDHSACGLALSLFKRGDFKESFSSYHTALQWLTNTDDDKSDLLVAMAGMQYKHQGIDQTKSLLFKSIQINKQKPSIPALLAIYSLGVLHSDQILSRLAIGEIMNLDDYRLTSIKGFLESYLLLKNNDSLSAIRKLSGYLHRYPDDQYLWQYISKYIILNNSFNPSIASKSAEKAIALSQSQKDINKNLKIASVSQILLENFRKSKAFALKAIHLYPDCAENWILLLCVLTSGWDAENKNSWLKKTINFVQNHLSPSASLTNWLSTLNHSFI